MMPEAKCIGQTEVKLVRQSLTVILFSFSATTNLFLQCIADAVCSVFVHVGQNSLYQDFELEYITLSDVLCSKSEKVITHTIEYFIYR